MGRSYQNLTDAVYVRLPVGIVEELRRQAMEQERTLSSQIRWLVQQALQMRGEETSAGCK
ncbi:Arc family DNA-binding protein [Thermodesulfobacteriota bacterium]